MKALVLRAEKSNERWTRPSIAWENAAEPKTNATQVLIEVKACGICGSDIHCVQTRDDGSIRYSGPVMPPVILGHEFTGIVVDIGSEVTKIKKGDLVASEGMIGCGVCRACRGGFPNQCADLRMIGLSYPGAFTKYIAVPERFCWDIGGLRNRYSDEQTACEVGALIEPLSCSFNGIFTHGGGMKPGEHVVIFGAGPIGLGAVMITRLAGASSITVFEPSEKRRKLAKIFGADEAIHPAGLSAGDIDDIIRKKTGGIGADLIVECAGAICDIMPAIENSFAPGGRLLYLGRTGESPTVALDKIVTGANKIIGSRGHVGGECFPRIISLLEHGRLSPQPMITTRMGMTKATDALQQGNCILDGKIMLAQNI